MIEIYKTFEDGFKQIDSEEEGCWIAMTNPTSDELSSVSEKHEIELGHLKAALDDEERARIEVEDDYTLILVDIPTLEVRNNSNRYVTIPLGIIVAKNVIITVCLVNTPILNCFIEKKVRDFYTHKKTRFILQILYKNAQAFLQNLRVIDKKSDEVERKLHISTKNQELIELLELEKSLVYFTTSLRSNEVVLEKMMKIERIKKYQEDEELLEDVIIENKQAIEMANIYSGILSGTMDAFASVISNNLNIVMKFLATVTIVLSVPTLIASLWGMNFTNIPLGNQPHGFVIVSLGALVITAITVLIFKKKDLF